MNLGVPSNLHPNIRRSSDAALISTALAAIYVCFNWERLDVLPYNTNTRIGIVVCSFAINIIIAWLIRLGVRWIRIPLLILTVLASILNIPTLFVLFSDNIWLGFLQLIQLGLQIYTSVILFMPETSVWYEKKKWGDFYDNDEEEEDDD